MIRQQKLLVGNTSIAVYETGTGANTILFLHGGGMAANYFDPQLQDASLQMRYRLIAIDLPGHGHSDRLTSERDYWPDALAQLLPPLLRILDVSNFVLVGLSYGTNIIGEITDPYADCKGLMLVSPCVMNDTFPPFQVITVKSNGHVLVSGEVSDADVQAYAYAHESDRSLADRYVRDFMNTDPNFRTGLGQFILTQGWADELENIKRWQLPVCVVYGQDDPLLDAHYLDNFPLLWQGKVHRQAGGHFINTANPSEFNALLEAFANAVFTNNPL